MTKFSIFILSLLCASFAASAQFNIDNYRFHCAGDTTEINGMIESLATMSKESISKRVVAAAKLLEGRPYAANTLEGDEEKIVVNIHEFDCVTFVENCFALAMSSSHPGMSWRDFVKNIEKLRYRRGECNGRYSSRLHYTADWINDNIYSGNIKEITTNVPGAGSFIKTLNYMTRNRDKYLALADSANYQECKDIELGFYSMKIPFLTKESAGAKDVIEYMRDGDMISFLSKVDGLDSSHVALLQIIDDKPYVIHASSASGKVVFETKPLRDYFKYNKKDAKGYRIIRLCD